jgi:hypothetical protein
MAKAIYILLFIAGLSLQNLNLSSAESSQSLTSFEVVLECIERQSADFDGRMYFSGSLRVSERSGIWSFDHSLVPMPEPEMIDRNTNGLLGVAWIAPGITGIYKNASLELVAFGAGDQIVARFPWQESWHGPYSLTLDDRIVVNKPHSPIREENGFTIIHFDGAQLQFTDYLDWPYAYTTSTDRLTFYVSPTGSQVIYDADFKTDEPYHVPGIILADIATHEVIWQTREGQDLKANVARWSPDGSHFAYPKQISDGNPPYDFYTYRREIALVDQAGQERILSNFTQNGAVHQTPSRLHWSRDGRKIAFWLIDAVPPPRYLSPKTPFGSTLHILDLDSQTISNLCVRSPEKQFPHFIWSPDSSSLIYVDWDTGIIMLIDLIGKTYNELSLGAFEVLDWVPIFSS